MWLWTAAAAAAAAAMDQRSCLQVVSGAWMTTTCTTLVGQTQLILDETGPNPTHALSSLSPPQRGSSKTANHLSVRPSLPSILCVHTYRYPKWQCQGSTHKTGNGIKRLRRGHL